MLIVANDRRTPREAEGHPKAESNRRWPPVSTRAEWDDMMTTLEVTNDPVRDYLNSIGRTRLLTADEEVALTMATRLRPMWP